MPSSSITQKSEHDIMSTVEKCNTDIMKSADGFVLKSSSDFATRSVHVFNKLNTIEVNHNIWISRNETHDAFDENGSEIKKPISSEFKKPFAPKPLKKRRTVLPYDRKNGRKWIKYSLADVPLSSDATNSAVAFEFLASLRKRKESESPTINDDDNIVFCKPKGMSSKLFCKNRSASIPKSNDNIAGKIMDESINTSNIKLSHLDDF